MSQRLPCQSTSVMGAHFGVKMLLTLPADTQKPPSPSSESCLPFLEVYMSQLLLPLSSQMLNWRTILKFHWSLPHPVTTSRSSTWITGPFSLWGVWSGFETSSAFLFADVFMWPTLSLVWAQLTNVCMLFSALFQFLGHEWQTRVKWLIA